MKDTNIILKSGDELTDKDKEHLMTLSIAEYPPYEKYYRINKYYSVIKPQIVGLILHNEEIIGDGKLLWQDFKIKDSVFKLFGFGLIIKNEFHGKGLGTELINQFTEKAKSLGADMIYATSDNPAIDHILTKLDFTKLRIPVYYTHAITGETEIEEKTIYVYFCNTEVSTAVQTLSLLNIGKGPI